jgi:hypothetical protein
MTSSTAHKNEPCADVSGKYGSVEEEKANIISKNLQSTQQGKISLKCMTTSNARSTKQIQVG